MARLSLILLLATFAALAAAATPLCAQPSPCVRSNGRPAQLADLGHRPVAGVNTLHFTFNSPGQPWTSTEITRMQKALAAIYPVAVDVYGAPAFDITINITKSSNAWYASGTNEIGIPNTTESTLCHEMLHGFHDDAIIAIGVYEEGMADAGTAAVMKRLDAYWSSNERHAGTQTYYDPLNRPEIAAWGGGFPMNALWQQRYAISDYAWSKLELELPTYLADFNRAYYMDRIASGIPTWGPSEVPRLKALVRAIKAQVEGLDFDSWYPQQNILDLWPAQGAYVLYQNGFGEDAVASMTWVNLFHRDASETPLANWPVRLRILDPTGHLLCDTTVATQYDGAAPFRVELPAAYQSYSGRLALIASAVTPEGATLADTVYHSRGREGGLFGVVVGAETGTVTAVQLSSGTTATSTLTNGCFELPALEMLDGTFRVSFSGADGRTAERLVTKDISPYYVGLVAGPLPTAVNPSAIASQAVILAPNPVSTGAELRFSTARPGPCRVTLHDVHGRLLRVLARERFIAAGPHRVGFAREDASGVRLGPGICFYRIVAGGETFTGRVAIVD